MEWLKITLVCLILASFNRGAESKRSQEDAVDQTYYDYNIELNESGLPKKLQCPRRFNRIPDLSDEECSILKTYNQTEVDLMTRDHIKGLAETCACQLLFLEVKWERSFDDEILRRVYNLVRIRTNETLSQDHTYPVYFWTDIEIVTGQVSIYTSTRDYFHRLKQHNSDTRLTPSQKQIIDKDPNWSKIKHVCRKISDDHFFLFRYLENLVRLDPSAFFRLVTNSDIIRFVYQASKACKLLLMLKLKRYKLRATDQTIVIANRPDGDTEGYNYVITDDTDDDTRDIESIIFQAKSLLPSNCHLIASHLATTNTSSCPIQFDKGDTGDNIKIWLSNNVTAPSIRSMAAVQCGCRLLQYSSTWDTMIKDPDVALMAKALTNYMNNNRVPDVADSPLWALHGWFEDIMSELTRSRKGPLKEIIKTLPGWEEDSIRPAAKDIESRALDLLRRGCLVVVLNYDPITRRKGRFRLVQYLDDLQTITSEPSFVFQLTLQDVNLFKIYALSKMCQPIL